jgi:hypothetical protein
VGLKTQVLDAFEEVPGVVREESSPESGDPFRQGGQQQGPVGDALGAGDSHLQGRGCGSWIFLKLLKNAGNLVGV